MADRLGSVLSGVAARRVGGYGVADEAEGGDEDGTGSQV